MKIGLELAEKIGSLDKHKICDEEGKGRRGGQAQTLIRMYQSANFELS